MTHTTNIQTLGGPIDVEKAAEAHANRYGKWLDVDIEYTGPFKGLRGKRRTYHIHCGQQSFTVNAHKADLPWEVDVEVAGGMDEEWGYIKAMRSYIGSIRGSGHTLQTAVYRFDCPTWGEEPDSVEEGA